MESVTKVYGQKPKPFYWEKYYVNNPLFTPEEIAAKRAARPQNITRKEFGAKFNAIFNVYPSFTEVVLHKEPLQNVTVTKLKLNKETDEYEPVKIDRRRLLKKVGVEDKGTHYESIFAPLREEATIEKVRRSAEVSSKRAIDNFFGYARSNKWQYFVTITVDPKRYGKKDEERIYLWKKFLQKLRYLNSNVKVIAVTERHVKGTLHFHMLIGDVDITNLMTEAINPRTGELLKTTFGQQIYNLKLWNAGFSTVVEIKQDKLSQSKVVSYLSKYMTKDNGVEYNYKRYFRTRNLSFKEHGHTLLNDIQIAQLKNDITIIPKTIKDKKRVDNSYSVFYCQDKERISQILAKYDPVKHMNEMSKTIAENRKRKPTYYRACLAPNTPKQQNPNDKYSPIAKSFSEEARLDIASIVDLEEIF